MIKLLKHNTAFDPTYIAFTSDLRFHVFYGQTSISAHDSITTAIKSIANERIYGVSDDAGDWERLWP